MTVSALRQYIKRGESFTGHCTSCVAAKMRERRMKTLKTTGTGRHINNQGYVVLSPYVVPEAHMPIFQGMYTTGCKKVMEHRYVMAMAIGRPLRSNECVDHMDGNKQNNDAKNLRIYLKGKQQPGSCHGYGTYYHEWQMALAEIAKLKRERH